MFCYFATRFYMANNLLLTYTCSLLATLLIRKVKEFINVYMFDELITSLTPFHHLLPTLVLHL